MTYGGENLAGDDYIKTEFNDFYGNTIGGMSNRIIMGVTENRRPDFYMDSELVVEDYVIDGDIALPVSVASGNSHVSSYGAEVTRAA